MNSKICIHCKQKKLITDFYRNKSRYDGYHGECKVCKAKQDREIRAKKNRRKIKQEEKEITHKVKTCPVCNMEKLWKEFAKGKNGKYGLQSECKECSSKYQRVYRKLNKEELKSKSEKYRENNKERKAQLDYVYLKTKRKEDEVFYIKDRIRSSIRNYINSSGNSHRSLSESYLGCTWNDLYLHLKNLGYERKKHHIDHVVPLAFFDLSKEDHRLVAFNYLNLQPLTPKENMAKGATLPEGYKEKINNICKALQFNRRQVIDVHKGLGLTVLDIAGHEF